MKKLIALLLAMMMLLALAGCDGEERDRAHKEETPKEETEGLVAEDAVDILEQVWGQYQEEEKPAVIGGHYSAEYTEGPATYDLEYASELTGTLLIPEEQMEYVVDAATMVHMMNANNMTIGTVKLEKTADAKAFADAVYQRITTNQWICGFPEMVYIAQVNEEFMVIAFGAGEILDVFTGYLEGSWNPTVIYNEAIM